MPLFGCLQAVCGGSGYRCCPPVCDISGRSNNLSWAVLPAAPKGAHGSAAQRRNCRPAEKAPGQRALRSVVCPWLHAPAGKAGFVRRAAHGVYLFDEQIVANFNDQESGRPVSLEKEKVHRSFCMGTAHQKQPYGNVGLLFCCGIPERGEAVLLQCR